MTATPPNLVSVQTACGRMKDHATVALWTAAGCPDVAAYHRLQMDTEFRALADLMGYDLVKRGGE